MNASCEPKARITFSQNASRVGVFAVRANGNARTHSGGFGGVQFLLQAIANWLICEMAVGVDHVNWVDRTTPMLLVAEENGWNRIMGLITPKAAKACHLKAINAVNTFITKSYKFKSFYFFK